MRCVCRILKVLLPAGAALLIAYPNAIEMRFFAGENGYFYKYVSGFSTILPAYGNVNPMLTGILSIFLTAWGIKTWNGGGKIGIFAAVLAAAFSLLQNMFGSPTVISWIVFGLLALLLLVYLLEQVCRPKDNH